MTHPANISEMVDALLEKIPEDELRVLCAHHADGWIDFATPSILAELDRRQRARLPWWKRIFT